MAITITVHKRIKYFTVSDSDSPNTPYGMNIVTVDDARFVIRSVRHEYDSHQRVYKHIWELSVQISGDVFDHETEPTVIYTINLDSHPDVPAGARFSTLSYEYVYQVEDKNEEPTDILLTATNGVVDNDVAADGTHTKTNNTKSLTYVVEDNTVAILGTLTGIDPDAEDDAEDGGGDEDNYFGRYKFYIDGTSNAGFIIPDDASRAESPELHFYATESELRNVHRLSVTIAIKDNFDNTLETVIAEADRLTRKEIYFIDITHTLTLSVPGGTIEIDEDTPYVFAQHDTIDGISIAGANGKPLTATLNVSHGTLDLNQTIPNSVMSMNTNSGETHTIKLIGIEEADLSAVFEGLTYTPFANYNEADTLSITVSGGGESITKSIGIDIIPVDDAPVLEIFDSSSPRIVRPLAHTVRFEYAADGQIIKSIGGAPAVKLSTTTPTITDVDSIAGDAENVGNVGYIIAGGQLIVRVAHNPSDIERVEIDEHITINTTLPSGTTGVYAHIEMKDGEDDDTVIVYRYFVNGVEREIIVADVSISEPPSYVNAENDQSEENDAVLLEELIHTYTYTFRERVEEAHLKPALLNLLDSLNYNSPGFVINDDIIASNVSLVDNALISINFIDGASSAASAEVGVVITDDREIDQGSLVLPPTRPLTFKGINAEDTPAEAAAALKPVFAETASAALTKTTSVAPTETTSAALIETTNEFTAEKTNAADDTGEKIIIRYYLPVASEINLWAGVLDASDYIIRPSALTGGRITALNTAIAEFEKYVNVDFVQVDEYKTDFPDIILIEGRFYDEGGLPRKATLHKATSIPGESENFSVSIFLPKYRDGRVSDDFMEHRALSELGYALGLRAPTPENGDAYDKYLPHSQRGAGETIYSDYRVLEGGAVNLQLRDIEALQELYTPNTETNADNTWYDFSDDDYFDRSNVIYDPADGIDTVDFKDFVRLTKLDLAPGARSTTELAGTTISITNDTIIENAIGSDLDDMIYGNNANNILEGGKGADTLDGRDGMDTASYAYALEGVTADMRGIESSPTNEVATDATVEAAYIEAILAAQAMHPTGTPLEILTAIYARFYPSTPIEEEPAPAPEADDAKGDKFINIEKIAGSSFDDTIIGNNDHNILDGGTFNANLMARRDTESGSGGDDTLTGNGGRDTFVVELGTYDSDISPDAIDLVSRGNDTITDFKSGIDKLEIRTFGDITIPADTTAKEHFTSLLAEGEIDIAFILAPLTVSGHSIKLTHTEGAVTSSVLINFVDTIADSVNLARNKVNITADNFINALGGEDHLAFTPIPTPDPDIV